MTTHLHIVFRLRISIAIPLLTLYAVTAQGNILFNITQVMKLELYFKRQECITDFDVQGSVHHKYIPLDIFPRCNFTQFIYFWKTALHVLGGIFTHHQEHI